MARVICSISQSKCDYARIISDIKRVRVTGPHTPVPYSKPLEQEFMPNEADVIASTKALLGV